VAAAAAPDQVNDQVNDQAHKPVKGKEQLMTDVFNPVEELRRNGLCGPGTPASTEQVLGTLTRPQVEVFVQVKRRVDAASRGKPFSPDQNAQLATAMTAAMGWDRPSSTLVEAEVEGMAAISSPAPGNCACLCTGGGGGGGA
jgi:hypothetical protein